MSRIPSDSAGESLPDGNGFPCESRFPREFPGAAARSVRSRVKVELSAARTTLRRRRPDDHRKATDFTLCPWMNLHRHRLPLRPCCRREEAARQLIRLSPAFEDPGTKRSVPQWRAAVLEGPESGTGATGSLVKTGGSSGAKECHRRGGRFSTVCRAACWRVGSPNLASNPLFA